MCIKFTFLSRGHIILTLVWPWYSSPMNPTNSKLYSLGSYVREEKKSSWEHPFAIGLRKMEKKNYDETIVFFKIIEILKSFP